MTNLNNTIAGTIAGANNMNNKGENTMELNREESVFNTIATEIVEAKAGNVYEMFRGYKNNTAMMMPKKVCFTQVEDVVKFLSNNYAIADATGMITEGVYRVLNATTIAEVSKSIRDFGKNGTEAATGQRYTEFGPLVKDVKVIPRLGGGTATVSSCSRFEVQEFFNKRVVNLDLNACNEEDLAAIKADMQIIGRVLQEIAIDIAKDKSLDAGVDLKKVFTVLPVLSRLIRKADDGLVDNVKSITAMVEDAISKNPVINTGEVIDSIPNYVVEAKKFDEEFIKDWASELQERLLVATTEFFNKQVMGVVKMAGVTKEDLEIKQLVVNNGACVDELVKVMDLYFTKYVRSLGDKTDHKNDEMNARVSKAKAAADKEVKAAFRDTLYAICAAYGHDAAMARKLVYGATMVKGIHKANMSKAMSVLGEEDMLLMWSNEEGVNMEAVNVEIAESFVDLFDAGVVTEMKVAFVDDVATNEFGEEVAYGIGMEALNGEGTIMAKENGFVFVPAKKTTVAPIGNKRVAFIDRAADNNGVLVPFMKGGQEIVPAQKAAEIADQIVAANNQAVYFVPKTTDGQAVNMKNIVTNVGIVVDAKDEQGNIVKVNKIVGTTIKVGQAYINDMFISYKEIAGEKVLANNKKHIIEQAINTESGILLVLSC